MDDESVDVDDGSVQLLMMPCVLVVMVLLFLVTACSSADGEVEKAGAVSAVSTVASTSSDDVESKDVASAKQQKDGQDDRMIQPEGHTGIWFETMPSDPLEKLVYESQRFVGHPVELEPLGDKALMPQWADMPDPCHPEVMRRMGELGWEDLAADSERVYDLGMVQCGVIGKSDHDLSSLPQEGFQWAVHDDVEVKVGDETVEASAPLHYGVANDGELAEIVGCIAVLRDFPDGFDSTAVFGSRVRPADCVESEYSMQVVINVNGGLSV